MRSTGILILPFLAAAGCAATTDAGARIAGTDWRLVQIDGVPPVSGQARISFGKNDLGASVGCNSIDGNWRVEDNRLIAGPLTQTEKLCTDPIWNQEEALNALLTSAPVIVVEGDRMTLKSSGRSAELRKVT